MNQLFTTTKNGIKVYYDSQKSHAVTHFAHNNRLENTVKEIISQMILTENAMRFEYDTQKIIGITDLVETHPDDEIIYAIRTLRSTYSRFVKNKQPHPTSWVTIDIRKNDNDYFLYTAFVGRLTPSFPGGNFLPEQSKDFWSRHALVWGNQEIVPGTETTECPWG